MDELPLQLEMQYFLAWDFIEISRIAADVPGAKKGFAGLVKSINDILKGL